MINNPTIRRPLLAMVAASAVLLGGAAMPKISLHNATLLYVAGQVRMALGDREAGLRLISSAAQQRDQLVASAETSSNAKLAPVSSKAEPKCVRKAASPVSAHSKFIVYSRSAEPSPASLANLATLQNVDFSAAQFDKAKFAAEMRQAAELRAAAIQQENRHTVARVRLELERRGIQIPPNPMNVVAPEAPLPPVTIP